LSGGGGVIGDGIGTLHITGEVDGRDLGIGRIADLVECRRFSLKDGNERRRDAADDHRENDDDDNELDEGEALLISTMHKPLTKPSTVRQ
jgi:hypothetical protein